MNLNSVSLAPSIDRVQVRLARLVPSRVSDWKSSNSRSPEHPVPPVQIGPLFTGVGSTDCSAERGAPPSVLSRNAPTPGAPSGTEWGSPAGSVWWSGPAPLEPLAATQG